MDLFRCEVCGLVYESKEAMEKCVKCDAPSDKHTKLEEDAAALLRKAEETNDIHAELIALSAKIEKLCARGTELGLDANCVKIFKRSKDRAKEIKAMCKSEIIGHTKKDKF